MKLAYFVHDLLDPAVHRRLRMLQAGGAQVSLLGFARDPLPATPEGGLPPICLGQTRNARMVHRTLAVLGAARAAGRWGGAVAGADVIMARQLETLVLAALARPRFAPKARLVFECLDIHRLMLARGAVGHSLRMIERYLLRRCDLLVVSSPAFLRDYFGKMHEELPPACVVENRIFASEIATPVATSPPSGPPWKIGWFGVIRCRRSLNILARLVRRLPGQIEVVIRGRPARDAIPEFGAVVAATPGLTFHGPYDRTTDLARIYADVHYVWTIDFYEEGANSAWLLPNRLYEGGIYGAVPIALRSVETGRWLIGHHAGICLDEPLEETLAAFLATLDPEHHSQARQAMRRVPLSAFVCDAADCRHLAATLAALQAAPT